MIVIVNCHFKTKNWFICGLKQKTKCQQTQMNH